MWSHERLRLALALRPPPLSGQQADRTFVRQGRGQRVPVHRGAIITQVDAGSNARSPGVLAAGPVALRLLALDSKVLRHRSDVDLDRIRHLSSPGDRDAAGVDLVD